MQRWRRLIAVMGLGAAHAAGLAVGDAGRAGDDGGGRGDHPTIRTFQLA